MSNTATESYEVRWRKTADSNSQFSTPVKVTAGGNLSVPGLERVTDYTFEARAISFCGAKSDWATQTFNIPGTPVPNPVTSLTAQTVADGVHLGWSYDFSVQDAGITFNIERSTSANGTFTSRAQTAATAYTDPETTGSTFYYRVSAVDWQGNVGAYSPVVSSQGVAVSNVVADVAAAANTAATALAEANAATAQLTLIASDGSLSPAEKPTVIRDYNVITTEQAGIDTQATAYGVTTEKTNYDNAVANLTSYLAGLTTPTHWNDKSGYTTITANTFDSAFTTVYANRQILLNKIYATAQSLANTAQTTANTALTQLGNLSNSQYLQNPFFSTGDLTGWTSDHGSVYFESGTNGPASGSTSYAVFPHGTASEALRNAGKIPVYPGAVIKAQCAVRGVGSPNGVCGVRISWRDASDAEISSTMTPNPSTGNATNGTYVTGTAPAGAMFAHVECATSGRTDTGGYYTVDNFAAWALADSMDQVPDGATRFGAVEAGADKTAGKSLTVLTDRTMDYIGDSATRFAAAEAGADKTEGKSIDVLTDGVSYARTASTAWAPETVQNANFLSPADANGKIPGWSPVNAALSIVPAGGPKALRFIIATDGVGGAYESQAHACRSGDVVSAQVTCSTTAGNNFARAQLQFFDGSGNALTPSGNYDVAVNTVYNTLQTATMLATAPAGSSSFRIFVYASSNPGTTILLLNPRISINDLRVAGSGSTVGDQRNLQPITWASQRSVLSNSPISYSISGTTVTFSVAAVTLQGGGISLNYGASSGSVTQTAGTTTTWFLYYRDAAQDGGTLPLAITTNPGGAASWPDSIFLGTASVTVNAGGGGSGGTGGGGGGYCVADNMFIGEGRRAGDADIGDPFDCIDLPTAAGKHVRSLQGFERAIEDCVRMITADGCALECSKTTPFDVPDGRQLNATQMIGETVITDLGESMVISLAWIGPRPVTRMHLGGVSFAAGADPYRRIYSHNASTVKP